MRIQIYFLRLNQTSIDKGKILNEYRIKQSVVVLRFQELISIHIVNVF
jgi:hypothetical protein